MSNSTYQDLVKQANTGKLFPALKLVRGNTKNAAVISKLVREPHRTTTIDEMTVLGFKQLSDSISEKIRSSENIMELFPDIELSAQILISSILSPKDMINTDIVYRLKDTILPPDLTMQLIDCLQRDMSQYYEFDRKLPEILREALFVSGAYVKVVIPESSVDAIINNRLSVSTEAVSSMLERSNIGILGPSFNYTQDKTPIIGLEGYRKNRAKKINQYVSHLQFSESVSALESAESEFSKLIEVTDNYEYLKKPRVMESLASNSISGLISSITLESFTTDKISDRELMNRVFKRVENKETPIVMVKTREDTNRGPIGRPLEIKIPTEACIPIYVPGEPRKHVGYFIILDEEGNPITYTQVMNGLSHMTGALNGSDNAKVTSILTQKAYNNLIGTRNFQNIDDYTRAYKTIVEADLVRRLKNGIYGKKLVIGGTNEIYQMMLSRTLSGQYTRLLYIPSDLTTYFALDYHPDGTGKSLMDNLKVLTSLRAILLFAKVMATAKNSIALTHVNLTLDPDDPDPVKTMEIAVNEVIKVRQQYFPLGINTPMDLVDWVQRAGLEFSFEGHPGIPSTKLDFETKNFQHQVPDNELDELLRKQTIMALGLSPETVDNGFSSEFATTVLANNILLSKRVSQIQERLIDHMSDYARKIIMNDFELRSELLDHIKADMESVEKFLDQDELQLKNEDETKFINYMIDKFASFVEVALPKPDITSIENQSTAFDQYSEAVDKCLEYWVSSSFMSSELVGEVSQYVDAVKVAFKAYLMRQWMSQNNFLPEIGDIVASDSEDKPIIEVNELNKDHIQGIMRSCLAFIQTLGKARKAGDLDVSKLGTDGEGAVEAPDTTSTDTTGSDTDDDTSTDDTGNIKDDLGNIDIE